MVKLLLSYTKGGSLHFGFGYIHIAYWDYRERTTLGGLASVCFDILISQVSFGLDLSDTLHFEFCALSKTNCLLGWSFALSDQGGLLTIATRHGAVDTWTISEDLTLHTFLLLLKADIMVSLLSSSSKVSTSLQAALGRFPIFQINDRKCGSSLNLHFLLILWVNSIGNGHLVNYSALT